MTKPKRTKKPKSRFEDGPLAACIVDNEDS
jgi:hypothetical protein